MSATREIRWSPHSRPLAVLAASIASLTIARLLLYLIYHGEFGGLDAVDVGTAFVRGLRFDLAVTVWFFAIPAWCMWWPARFARSAAWQAFWGWTAFSLFSLLLLLATADLAYFSVVRRHIGHDLVVGFLADPGAVVLASGGYPLFWLGLAATVAGSYVAWRRALRRPLPSPPRRGPRWIASIVLVPLAVLAARGGVQEMPLATVDAFRGPSIEGGYLALNGPFSVIYSTLRTGDRWPVTLDRDRAIELFRSGRALPPGEVWRGAGYPLQRDPLHARAGGTGGAALAALARSTDAPNVVLVVFEGLDAWVSDAIRVERGLPPLGATPNFDALSRRGILFTRLLGHGQLSIEGLGALLSSFPSLPALPTHGRGLGLTRLTYLGSAARAAGYETYFVRSAHRESFRLDAFSALAGFGHYAGREDILAEIDPHTDAPHGQWGAWDFDSFRYLHRRLETARRPFLAVFFGSSSHPPYRSPGAGWRPFPDDEERGRYLNSVHYVDWALGEFVRLADEAGYLEETIWVVTSDQPSRLETAGLDPADHAVPTLIFGPGIPEGRVDGDLASLLDLMPTIIDAAGWPVSHASFGQSLLRPRDPGALLRVGEVLVRASSEAWVAHAAGERIAGEGPPDARDRVALRLQAEVQLLGRLVRENRVFSGVGR